MLAVLSLSSFVSPGTVGLAVAGTAALAVLQLLRQQPTRRVTPTLQFWQSAVVPQRPRLLWSRQFGRMGSFVIPFAVVLLLASVLSAGRWGRADGVVVIDAGRDAAEAAAAGGTVFASSVAAAGRLAATGRRPAVLTAGAAPVVREPAGTPLPLSVATLSGVSPEAAAADPAAALRLAGDMEKSGSIDWYTRQTALPPGIPPATAARVRLHRVAAGPAVRIVRSVVSESTDGRCDVDLGFAATDARRSTCDVSFLRADGHAWSATAALAQGRGGIKLVGLPSDGSTLTVSIAGQNSGTVRVDLPRRPALTFWFGPDVPSPLRDGLLSFGTTANAPGAGVIRVGTQPAQADDASIQLVAQPRSTEPLASVRMASRGGDPLESARAEVPTDWPRGTEPLLIAGDTPVAGLAAGGRTLWLAESLVRADADLPRRAIFTVLLRQWCDRMTDRRSAAPVVAASRVTRDPLWTPGDRAPAEIDSPPETESDAPDAPAAARTWPGVATALLLAALVAAVVDGWLWAARRVV